MVSSLLQCGHGVVVVAAMAWWPWCGCCSHGVVAMAWLLWGLLWCGGHGHGMVFVGLLQPLYGFCGVVVAVAWWLWSWCGFGGSCGHSMVAVAAVA